MAEGGVEQSETSFQQGTTVLCEVCLIEDNFKSAQWFCQECRQCLCEECLEYHRNDRDSSKKSHEIVRVDKISSTIQQSQEEKEETFGLQNLEQVETDTVDVNQDPLRQLSETETDTKKIEKVRRSQEETIEAQVEETIKELERVTKDGSEEEIFSEIEQAGDILSQYIDILREMYLEDDDTLTDIKPNGDVQEEKTNTVVNLSPEVTEVLNTHQSDREIWWFDVSSNDQMILLDYDATRRTSKLSLYGADKKLLSQLSLPYAISAATLNNHQLVVPLLGNSLLQIVNITKKKKKKRISIINNINNNLIFGPLVQIDVTPCLILKYSDNAVLLLAEQSDNQYCFQILDLGGKVKKHIKPGKDLQEPGFMRISPHRNTIYILDHYTCCLGFNLQGDVIFHYAIEDYDLYFGLAIDQHQALYFTAVKQDQGIKSVVKVSLATKDLVKVDIKGSYPLQCIGDKLYIVGCSDKKERTISYFYV